MLTTRLNFIELPLIITESNTSTHFNLAQIYCHIALIKTRTANDYLDMDCNSSLDIHLIKASART